MYLFAHGNAVNVQLSQRPDVIYVTYHPFPSRVECIEDIAHYTLTF